MHNLNKFPCFVVHLLVFLGLFLKVHCDGASVKFLKTPPAVSDLNSAAFSFRADNGDSCSNCTSFSCKLDDFGASNCMDGEVSYTGLKDGNHTLEVCTNGSHGVGCTTYSWIIDTIPPTASVTAATPFTSGPNVSVYISFSEPCAAGDGFRCVSVNDCSLLVYGAAQVIPSTLKTIQPNLQYSITVSLSPSVQYGRLVLVMDKNFCKDTAGNKFTRTANSSFFVHFDRRNVFAELRTHIPEQLLQLNSETRTVQATNRYKNLKVYLYFTKPVMNSSADILKSLHVSQGSLVPTNSSSLGNRRIGFQLVDIPSMAIVTVTLESGLVLTWEGNPISPVAPVTFLYDSERPSVRLSTTCTMRTRQKKISVSVKFMKPVFGFNSSHLSIYGGNVRGFHEISKSIYVVEIQPNEDMISVHVPENTTSDVAGNKNLASNVLQLTHYSVPATCLVLSSFATAALVVTALIASLLIISTACLQTIGAFATPSALLTSDPARNLFRIICHVQFVALSRWLAVPLPVEFFEFARGLQWSIPYFSLPWEKEYVKPSSNINPQAYGKFHDLVAVPSVQSKTKNSIMAASVYGLPLTEMEYRSFFEIQNIKPEAEYILDPRNIHGWRDFNKSMFWLAAICGCLILLHALLFLLLKLKKRNAKQKSTYGALVPLRFEIFLVILALPCISEVSVTIIKGGSSSGITVGILLLGLVSSLLIALFMFLSGGISLGKLLQYKEVHRVDEEVHWYQELVRVTLGPGKRGQWTWNKESIFNWLTILGPLFEDLRGPPKYMLSQISGGNFNSSTGSIIASDDETEDAEAPFLQKLFGILRIYYVLLESVRRVILGILAGAYSKVSHSKTPTITLLCITSFQLSFVLLKKPFIKKKVQLVEIISLASEVGIFACCLALLENDYSTHHQTRIAITMICLFFVAFLAQLFNEWHALCRQTKQLDPDGKSFFSGLKIASIGLLLLFVPIKLVKSLESRFPLKSRRSGDTGDGEIGSSESRSSSTLERPWVRQLRELARASFNRESGGRPSDPSTSRTGWSGLWGGKRSGSSSLTSSMDSKAKPKSKPKGLYKDFEAIFAPK